jgi:hypothetical protein
MFGFTPLQIAAIICMYVISCLVITFHIRLEWWQKQKCENVSSLEKEQNGPIMWAVWLASIYIALISIYILYVIGTKMMENKEKILSKLPPLRKPTKLMYGRNFNF